MESRIIFITTRTVRTLEHSYFFFLLKVSFDPTDRNFLNACQRHYKDTTRSVPLVLASSFVIDATPHDGVRYRASTSINFSTLNPY